MQHEGSMRYELVTGQYLNNGVTTGSGRATFIQGVTDGELTLYGGLLYAEGSRSLAQGDALSLGSWAGLSTDGTCAQTQLSPGIRAKGSLLRAGYTRQWDAPWNPYGGNRSPVPISKLLQLPGFQYSRLPGDGLPDALVQCPP